MSLCTRCTDRGSCCRTIHLNLNPPLGSTALEALCWVASVIPAPGELSLPFLPTHKEPNPYVTCPLEEWAWTCIYITDKGECLNYDNRPKLCHNFKAGYNEPCTMLGYTYLCESLPLIEHKSLGTDTFLKKLD